MKIGLLSCVHLDEQMVREHGTYANLFEAVFSETHPKPELIVFDVLEGEYPADIDDCDAYLISGSPAGVHDDLPWIHALEAFIIQLHQRKKKLIGVCFGHQLIAKVFGGEVGLSSKGWGIGVSQNQVTQTKPWMTPECAQFNILASHQDQIIKLPKQAEILASNAHCEYYLLQWTEDMISIQGHPELNKTFLKALMDSRKDRIEPQRYQEGLASFALENDNHLVAQWIVNFIGL